MEINETISKPKLKNSRESAKEKITKINEVKTKADKVAKNSKKVGVKKTKTSTETETEDSQGSNNNAQIAKDSAIPGTSGYREITKEGLNQVCDGKTKKPTSSSEDVAKDLQTFQANKGATCYNFCF